MNRKAAGFLLAGLFILTYVRCSPVSFDKDPEFNKCQGASGSCVRINGMDEFEDTHFISGPRVDILFVDDNSGSMSPEQSNIAKRFSSLLNRIQNLDYRIAVTTTDISYSENNPPRSINLNGQLQDGNLVVMSDGQKFVSRDSVHKEDLFSAAIQRPETAQCEQWMQSNLSLRTKDQKSWNQGIFDNCPSGDERGVYAAIMAITQHGSEFIRPGAHLAVVFVADENERSFGQESPDGSGRDAYLLEDNDKANSLIDAVKTSVGADKTFSVHSIIVKPGDSTCLRAQSNQMAGLISGNYGTIYAQAAQLTNGVIGSVCEADYGAQLGEIGGNIVDRVSVLPLACQNPQGRLANNQIIEFNPAVSDLSYHMDGKNLVFNRDIPPNTVVHLKYGCPTD
jgi:hypothetical protein